MWGAVFCIAETVFNQVCVFGWAKKTADPLGIGGFWGLRFCTFLHGDV